MVFNFQRMTFFANAKANKYISIHFVWNKIMHFLWLSNQSIYLFFLKIYQRKFSTQQPLKSNC